MFWDFLGKSLTSIFSSIRFDYWTLELLKMFGSQGNCSALMILNSSASSISCAGEQAAQHHYRSCLIHMFNQLQA